MMCGVIINLIMASTGMRAFILAHAALAVIPVSAVVMGKIAGLALASGGNPLVVGMGHFAGIAFAIAKRIVCMRAGGSAASCLARAGFAIPVMVAEVIAAAIVADVMVILVKIESVRASMPAGLTGTAGIKVVAHGLAAGFALVGAIIVRRPIIIGMRMLQPADALAFGCFHIPAMGSRIAAVLALVVGWDFIILLPAMVIAQPSFAVGAARGGFTRMLAYYVASGAFVGGGRAYPHVGIILPLMIHFKVRAATDRAGQLRALCSAAAPLIAHAVQQVASTG